MTKFGYAISSEEHHPLEIVRQTCTRASLAAFAWGLFQVWLHSGTPASYNWAFTALGLLGDDETARRLAPLVREWPGQSATARAVTGTVTRCVTS